MKAFDDGEFTSSAGMLAHEIAEQTEKQGNLGLKGKKTLEGYDMAHNGPAIAAENGVNESKRVSDDGRAIAFDSNGHISGRLEVKYSRGGVERTVKVFIKNGNVYKVSD